MPNLDIILAIGVGLLTATMAYMGVQITLRPPESDRAKACWTIGFIATALLACVLLALQTKRSGDAQSALQTQLTNIQRNTEHPTAITVNPLPVVMKLPTQPVSKAKLQFSFFPVKTQDDLVDTISKPIVNGVVLVEFTAKNVGTAQANNGQIWIQICDGCRFAAEPEGSTSVLNEPMTRRKRFDSLHEGVFFEQTALRIVPPSGISTFTIAFKYACEACPPLDNEHPQKLRVNVVSQ
jgi:hypothetical protein